MFSSGVPKGACCKDLEELHPSFDARDLPCLLSVNEDVPYGKSGLTVDSSI